MWRRQPDLCFRKQLISRSSWHRLPHGIRNWKRGWEKQSENKPAQPESIRDWRRYWIFAEIPGSGGRGRRLVKTELWRRRWDPPMYRGCRMTGMSRMEFLRAENIFLDLCAEWEGSMRQKRQRIRGKSGKCMRNHFRRRLRKRKSEV